ncbi:hypothetical protein [Aliikangiella sp. IMCC44632]
MEGLKVKKNIQGQATVEYIVVCSALVLALFSPIPDGDPDTNESVIEILVEAVKTEYEAYKYANSVATLPLP